MVSIVVPVYNAEQYLEECIQSVCRQTCGELELILVNDGSEDNSLQICRELAKQDPRITVIDQPNGGVSAARNTGLQKATGEFVLFLDADDLIELDAVERLLTAAEADPETDLVVAGFRTIGKQLYNDTAVLEVNRGLIEKERLYALMVTMEQERIRENVVRCLFRRQMLRESSIRFKVGMKIAEDYLFFLQSIDHARKIYILPIEVYIYRVNETSATASYISCLTEDMSYLDEWVAQHLCGRYPALVEGYHQRRALTYLRTIQNMCLPKSPYSKREIKKRVREIRKGNTYACSLKAAYKAKKRLSKVDRLSISMLRWKMDRLYISLYCIYKKHQGK